MATDGWAQLAAGMQAAGAQLDELLADADPRDQQDGRRALLRALNNRLARIENDGGPAELAPFNGWREKFFMDNPNYRYWISDLRGDGTYEISGNVGDSVYQSITVYAGSNIATAKAVARVDSDGLDVDEAGNFTLTLARNSAGLSLPADASSVWVRYIHDQVMPQLPGQCRIETLDTASSAPGPDRLDRDLAQLGQFLGQLPGLFGLATAAEREQPNTVRHWSAMAGGAAFTEPGIHYLRGGWQLEPDQVLLIDGVVPDCRNWNIVLYNRFLNSLDYRSHLSTHTGATATVRDGRYRFALAARDPQLPDHDWLDTQGRSFGLFVLRFLQPAAEPELPAVTVQAIR